jgi:hypothetical protein
MAIACCCSLWFWQGDLGLSSFEQQLDVGFCSDLENLECWKLPDYQRQQAARTTDLEEAGVRMYCLGWCCNWDCWHCWCWYYCVEGDRTEEHC